jgi:phosphoribosylformylglycinamidine synthase
MPRTLILTTAGINCERELAEAFALAGAAVEMVHLNTVMDDPARIDRFDLIGLPGGFSYGDAVAAGRIAAQLMRQRLYPAFVRAIERGVPIIAPCNGFQMAVQLGLLPGPLDAGGVWPATPPVPSVTLAVNESARFVDRWTRIEIPAHTRCIWTRGLEMAPEAALLPVAHGEGRFVPESTALLERLDAAGCIAVRYAPDDDPNGSVGHVAGLCDASGLVFGLMPHPERYTRWTQHPWWTRLGADARRAEPPGLTMFRNAVTHAAQVAV